MPEKVDWFEEQRKVEQTAAPWIKAQLACYVILMGAFFAIVVGVPYKFIIPVGIGVLVLSSIEGIGERRVWSDWLYKSRDKLSAKDGAIESLEIEKLKLRQQLGEEIEFRKQFNPTQEQVVERLKAFAATVREACEEEAKLLGNGMFASTMTIADPEEQATNFAVELSNRHKKAKARVHAAKEAFWKFWKLAADRDYLVQKSWRPYASLPWDKEKAPADKDFPFRDRGDGVGILVPREHVGVKC